MGDAWETTGSAELAVPEVNDQRLTAVSIDKVRLLASAGLDTAKVVLLYMMRPPGVTYPNSTPNAARS